MGEFIDVEKRTDYLKYSLVVENLLSAFIAQLLNISDQEQSKTFGNKSTALSFNSKVNLLLDMNIIEKNDLWKFVKFMEIRNQFMHNWTAKNYEKCFQFVEGKNKLLETYPQEKPLPLEQQLEVASIKLAQEVCDLTKKAAEKIISRISTEGYKEGLALTAVAFQNTVKFLNEMFPDIDELGKQPINLFMGAYKFELEKLQKDKTFSLDQTVTWEEVFKKK